LLKNCLMMSLRRMLRFASVYPAIIITIFLALSSITFSLLKFNTFSLWKLNYLHTFILASLLFGSFILSIYICSQIAVKTVTPKLFSKLTISGSSLNFIFKTVAKSSKKLHHSFDKITQKSFIIFSAILETKDKVSFDDPNDIESILNRLWDARDAVKVFQNEIVLIEKYLLNMNEEFQRAEHLILEASRELKIPEKRFKNHVIQFIPELFKNRIIKYKENLEELTIDIQTKYSDKKGVTASAIFRRIYGLAKQNQKIKKICTQRIDRANDIIELDTLHAYVSNIASSRSTTTSLIIYSNELSLLAKKAKERLTNWRGSLTDPNYKEVVRRFQFIFRKQKAYPGFDPHEVLIRLFSYHLNETEIESSKVKNNILLTLVNFKSYFRDKKCFFLDSKTYENLIQKDDKKIYYNTVLNLIDSLTYTGIFAKDLTTSYKEQLVDRFREEIIPNFFKGTSGRKYIVTHGYSKSIRQIIKHGLKKGEKDKNYIFILEGIESNPFDSLLMKFELQSEVSSNRQYFGNISIGNFSVLTELINSSNDKVMILIGAECFDGDGKVVIGKGFNEQYRKILRLFVSNSINFTSIIAAESFKGETESISNTEPFDDHFDRVDILNSKKFDSLVTNNEIIEFRNIQKKSKDISQFPGQPST